MTVDAPQRSLHRKLAEVMAEVGRVPKNGQGPGYKFAAAADVSDVSRAALAARNITLMPVAVTPLTPPEATTLSGKQALLSLLVTWRYTDGDSDEYIEFQTIGTGADSTDKAAPKAMTNAQKYAYLMSLCMSTGDDPEASDHGSTTTAAKTRAAPARVAPVKTETASEMAFGALEAINHHVRAISGSKTARELRGVGEAIAGDGDLTEEQLAYLQKTYLQRQRELKAGDDAAA